MLQTSVGIGVRSTYVSPRIPTLDIRRPGAATYKTTIHPMECPLRHTAQSAGAVAGGPGYEEAETNL